jgi:hypothetical protein
VVKSIATRDEEKQGNVRKTREKTTRKSLSVIAVMR